MAGPMRQHYNLACGGALTQVDGSKKVLKLAKGGHVRAIKRGDKFTSITQKGGHLAKGFKVQK